MELTHHFSQLLNRQIHAEIIHAVLTVSKELQMELAFVHASQDISISHQTVDPNVLRITNALCTWPVTVKNVLIPVSERVALTHYVSCKIY
jgi:hypothetical protein